MARKSPKVAVWVTVVLILALSLISMYFLTLNSILPQTVSIPVYSNLICQECLTNSHVKVTDTLSKTRGTFGSTIGTASKDYYCGTENLQGYFPYGCTYTINSPNPTDRTLYFHASVCKNGVCPSSDENIQQYKVNSFRGQEFKLEQPDKLRVYLSGGLFTSDEADVLVTGEGVRHCLVAQNPDGTNRVFTEPTCHVEGLFGNRIKAKDPNYVSGAIPPATSSGAIQHWITGYTQQESVNVVGDVFLQLSDNPSGIQECPFATDLNQKKYVDEANCHLTSKYECIPSNPPPGYLCPEGKKVLAKEGVSCQSLAGKLTGGTVVQGSKKCDALCVNGALTITNCKEIEHFVQPPNPPLVEGNCAEGETYVKKETSVCGFFCKVGLAKADVTKEGSCQPVQNNTPLIIGIVALVLIFLLLLIIMTRPQQSRPSPVMGGM